MPNIFKPKRSTTASSVPTTGNLSDGELAVNLTDRKVFVRNGASIVTVADALVDGDKGDITVSSSGASWAIDAGVVTNAKLANVSTATIKGRATAGIGSPEDLTGTQATALLDTFTTSLKGLAPASGGGTSNFLRADGTWAAPVVSGNLNVGIVTATSFVKSGGTSSQFLKADGSVDSNTYITSASVGNGTLSLGVSGTGLSGTASFTANQSGNTTFTVTSNATSANTVNAIVSRDGSGNFIAGIITATTFSGALSGNATSATTATTATSATSATSAGSVTNSVTFNNGGTGAASGTTFNGSAAQTISHNTIGASPLAGSTSLTTTGTVTTGTWSGSFGAVSGANLTTLTAGNLSGTIPSGVLGNSSVFIGTTSIALNRASASQSLTGVSIDGNAGTATTLSTIRTIWGQNFNGSQNVSGALSGATDITATGTIKGNQVIGGTGSAIGSAGLIVNGTTGDNDSQLIIKKPSQSSFGVLAWDGQVYLSANIYYDNGAWVHSAPTSNTTNNMLVLQPGTGSLWYASNNSSGSWNVAGGLTLWNDSGVWQRSLSNTLTLNTSGTGLSGSTTYNNSGAATFTVTLASSSANTPNNVVVRDGSGNFSAGIITATTFSGALSGNATSATTATSATSAGSVTNSVTFNNGGSGAASGTTFNGSAAQTISYNSIGASPLAGSASLTTTGTVTTGTWSSTIGAVSGASLTNLTAANLNGTIPSGVLGNSSVFIGTTSIALNRASGAQTLTGVSIDGNAATATQLTPLDDRIISPSEISTSRLQFGFTSWANNNTAPYADYLHLRSYTDGSGGNDNLVMFRKDAIGMRIWQQTYGSATAYASFKDVCWTDGTNATGTGWAISITGSSASCTGNALTATTLQNQRTIWGQNFNGSQNVSGALTGVTDITATGNVAVDGAFRAESSNSTERFDIYYNETTDSLDFDYLTV